MNDKQLAKEGQFLIYKEDKSAIKCEFVYVLDADLPVRRRFLFFTDVDTTPNKKTHIMRIAYFSNTGLNPTIAPVTEPSEIESAMCEYRNYTDKADEWPKDISVQSIDETMETNMPIMKMLFVYSECIQRMERRERFFKSFYSENQQGIILFSAITLSLYLLAVLSVPSLFGYGSMFGTHNPYRMTTPVFFLAWSLPLLALGIFISRKKTTFTRAFITAFIPIMTQMLLSFSQSYAGVSLVIKFLLPCAALFSAVVYINKTKQNERSLDAYALFCQNTLYYILCGIALVFIIIDSLFML